MARRTPVTAATRARTSRSRSTRSAASRPTASWAATPGRVHAARHAAIGAYFTDNVLVHDDSGEAFAFKFGKDPTWCPARHEVQLPRRAATGSTPTTRGSSPPATSTATAAPTSSSRPARPGSSRAQASGLGVPARSTKRIRELGLRRHRQRRRHRRAVAGPERQLGFLKSGDRAARELTTTPVRDAGPALRRLRRRRQDRHLLHRRAASGRLVPAAPRLDRGAARRSRRSPSCCSASSTTCAAPTWSRTANERLVVSRSGATGSWAQLNNRLRELVRAARWPPTSTATAGPTSPSATGRPGATAATAAPPWPRMREGSSAPPLPGARVAVHRPVRRRHAGEGDQLRPPVPSRARSHGERLVMWEGLGRGDRSPSLRAQHALMLRATIAVLLAVAAAVVAAARAGAAFERPRSCRSGEASSARVPSGCSGPRARSPASRRSASTCAAPASAGLGCSTRRAPGWTRRSRRSAARAAGSRSSRPCSAARASTRCSAGSTCTPAAAG